MFDDGWEDGSGPAPTWSRTPPGAALALALEAAEPVAVGVDEGFDAAERLGAWEALAAWATARGLRESAEYLAARQARVRQCSRDVEDERLAVAMELAAYTRVAPRTGEYRLEHAVALVDRLPRTLEALENAQISYSHARVVLDQTGACDDATARRVDAAVWDRPAREQTPTQLRESVRRIVARVDPEHLRRRAQTAVRGRGVRYWAEEDGATGVVQLRLPAPEARGVYAVIDHLARTAGDASDEQPRTLDNTRADVLRDLVLDRSFSEPDDAEPGGSPVRTEVRVVVPWRTLAGLSDEPGELEGHGPVPADQARAMAAGTDAVWQRLLTDPVTGTTAYLDRRRYRPPRRLAEFVRARDRTCRAPGCRVPAARCDLDHRIPYDHTAHSGGDGPTQASNLGPQCRRHHRIKTRGAWSCSTVSDPTGAHAPAVRWTAATGRTWLVRAPEVDEPTWGVLRPAPSRAAA